MKVYRHNKTGDLYYFLFESDHTETGERLVNYIRSNTHNYKVYSRPISNFHGLVEIGGKKVPRFEHIDDDSVVAIVDAEIVLV